MTKLNDKSNQDFQNVDKFKKEVISPIFPNAKLARSSMWSSPDKPATSFKGQLSPINLFKGSVYEYKGNWKFLHFTNLFSLKAILENGFLRMSEFSNLIDNKEIRYATKAFGESKINPIIKEKIEEQKENLFCLSLCESNKKTKTNAFMWEAYADKGKGVLIEFGISKQHPSQFVFGEIQYGEDKLKPLIELKNLTEKFTSENPEFFPNNFTELFMEVFSFHKVKRYEIEKEVRMIMKVEKLQGKEHELESIYKDINNNQEVKYFNKLFLKGRHSLLDLKYPFSDDKEQVLNQFPQIKIKNIVLGYGLTVEKKVALTYLLNEIKRKYNYEYQISQITNDGNIIKMC